MLRGRLDMIGRLTMERQYQALLFSLIVPLILLMTLKAQSEAKMGEASLQSINLVQQAASGHINSQKN